MSITTDPVSGRSRGAPRRAPCARRCTLCARRGLALLFLAWLSLAGAAGAGAQELTKVRVIVHGHPLTVDLADTGDLQVRGLSGRAKLGPDDGMLFVYPDEGDRVFWMREMLIPIDMIWFRNNRVVHIEPSVPAPPKGSKLRELPTYRSVEPANMVLELAAGRARELGLKPGDRVEFRFD